MTNEVGEGGNLLSTGQKQLISLARAVLAKPEIFIMDEATSSVDTLTEALIQRGMETLMEGRTSFVIAHRLSTIKRADRILVIEDGRIAEMGTHAELLRSDGHYYRLYTQQFRHEFERELRSVRDEGARLCWLNTRHRRQECPGSNPGSDEGALTDERNETSQLTGARRGRLGPGRPL